MTSDYQWSSLPQLRHFRATYSDPLPPIWMLVDCLSYGDFKKIFYKGVDPSIKR
ncbi:Abi family protein [Bifidobacterium sp. B4001]|nr:Abi family protein [Bifidobacterium sp. B4079]MCX8680808.1 Abi family protein [Bifidobacterium sp. B4001]